ncbi:MAG: hypothetical protein C5B45_02475 [Chlamydiae bacterium]|nr:MAG: hypothetical protein C5B45_02475 [Chlamydiota bacterium]
MSVNLSDSYPIYKGTYGLPLLGKIPFTKGLSSGIRSFFNPSDPSLFSVFLDQKNIEIIEQLSSFGKTLEQYHPGKIRKLLNKFARKYEENQQNLDPLQDTHTKTLEEIEKEYHNITNLSDDQRTKASASFNKFSEKFKALINTYDAEKLQEAYCLLDAFNEIVMQSRQLYIGLDKVVKHIESKHIFLQTFKEQLNSIILLKEQFNPDLTDQGFNQITRRQANRAGLLDLVADVNAILQTLVPKTARKTIGKNDNVKNELLKTILQKKEEVVSFMQTRMERHRTSVFKKIRSHLEDDISSYEELQKKLLELLPNDKKAQDLLLDLQKMRCYFKDDAPRSSCNILKEKLELLLKEQPYLFTEREKRALTHLLKNLSVIAYGKRFHKEDVQELLNQCQNIIKELLPKETIFSQITTSLSQLEISLIRENITPNEHKHVTDLLNEFIQNPKISFKEDEKQKFLDLKRALSFDPSQPIPRANISSLQPQKCLTLVKEIEERFPAKEGSKLAIERELGKWTKHATNLTLMMSMDKAFFHSTRDSLFYHNIIQKSEEMDCCPKQLFLEELKIQEFPTWKIVLAKVCFFVTKHLKIENFIHRTISRAISNYSTMIYQKLGQEYTHDQLQALSQKLIENATIYFHLLSSAISNAKVDAQRFPDQEQVTRLIIDQLLSLRLGSNEAALRELNLHNLYSELVDDLVEKSESGLLKWIVFYLDKYEFLNKHELASSIIKTGTDSFIKPAANGAASVLNLLVRDGFKALYKKLQQLEQDFQEELLPSSPLIEEFVEKLMQTFAQHRDIQQIASSTKIAVAKANLMRELDKHAPKLEGILDQQIRNYEQFNYNTDLLLDVKNTQALGKKDKEPLFILPILRDTIKRTLKIFENLLPQISSETTQQEHTISVNEVISDKRSAAIKAEIDGVIREKITLALTKLLKAPPSEETLYDWLYQGLALTNQAIERLKENKEKQTDVKKEITELLSDISAFIASTAPKIAIKKITGMERLSSTLAEKNPIDLPAWISPIIQERLQNIVDLVTQEALYRPELVAQLGRRVILPTTAFLRPPKKNLPSL